MAKGFKQGGGSLPLNFKVIGNPQPATAKENTIWVDTDKINNYYFSATQPENMVDYDVWFTVATSSNVEFNALKKNCIQIYPLFAMQYVGGAWIRKTAKSFRGSEWVDWSVYLYRNGDECTDITGGWTGKAWGNNGGYSAKDPRITKNSDHIHYVPYYGGNALHIINDIDFDDISELLLTYIYPSNSDTTVNLVVIDRTQANQDNFIAGKVLTTASQKATLSLDVSTVTGKRDVALAAKTTNNNAYVDMYELEVRYK